MTTIYCKDGKPFEISNKYISYFETISDQLEYDTNICYTNIVYEDLEMVYEYLQNIIQDKHNLVSCNNIPNMIYVSDFLCCKTVLYSLIQKVQNIIKYSYNTNTLRNELQEDRVWSDNEYEDIRKQDSWCVKINNVKSKLLTKI